MSLRIPETWSFAHYNKKIYIFIIVDDFDNPFSLMTIMTNDNRDNVVALQSKKNASESRVVWSMRGVDASAGGGG